MGTLGAFGSEPTLVFNFEGMSGKMIRATIIHQFGHALGLGHTLMKPGDWDILKKFVDQDAMKRCYDLENLGDFEVQWTGRGMTEPHYDDDSVMQYL